MEGMSLDNPHVDKAINAGTTAANCQPRHTRESLSLESVSEDDDDSTLGGDGSGDNDGDANYDPTDGSGAGGGKKPSRQERKAMKKEKAAAAAAARKKKEQEDPKKIGYIQMAKMGYQELVNAIIRPPRAEYKVSCCSWSMLVLFLCVLVMKCF